VAALPKPVVEDGPVRELFEALHELHHRAGWPSLRDIAKQVGCSHTTVSAAFSEPKVPRWGLLELIVECLGGDTGVFHRLWMAAGSGGDPAPAPAPVSAQWPPRQLINDIPGFTGRRDELAALHELLPPDGTAVVVAISGTAGVGKTALAVHWAHQVREQFPDGQLYLNLRGFDPDERPVLAVQAVRALLDAFDIPPQRIPATLEAQVALYRSVLAERRVLVVLDNARDAEHVRPLLPGTAGCLTVVTSRSQLSGLVAREGARPIVLDLMPRADARALIARRLGARRAEAEPVAVDQIVEHCARLPLALTVVAARAATHPRFTLAMVAAELRAARGSLRPFDDADQASDIRTVLSWSYRQLSPEAAHLFRALGAHPGPDVTAAATASVIGAELTEARGLLAELADTNLIAEPSPGRYRFHDLLRVYAAELAPADTAIVHRLLDHYLHTAHRAALLLNTARYPITLDPVQPGTSPEEVADHAQALAWFTAEHPVLLAAARLAAARGFDRHTWQLAWTLTTFLDRQGHWQEWRTVQSDAVEAARRLADPEGLAYAHRGLGLAHYRLGDYERAHTELAQALASFVSTGDRAGQAFTHLDICWVFEREGRFAEALDHAGQALRQHEVDSQELGHAIAFNSVGWLQAKLGDYRDALEYCTKAHELFARRGDQIGVGATWDSLGYIHHHLGDYPQAIACYTSAVAIFRDVGDRFHEAESLANLGETHRAATDRDGARQTWDTALRILEDLGHPHAVAVRTRLEGLD
jgi:tetratricopeptide (TPR) repeat protein